ncbi:MAG: hypothetical protein IPJ77_07355 [Planctomycetes bacterium]|nr:hypothetical protein [Planctomycetota bacterium]
MSELSAMGTTARGLARNPLGVIALFIVLIYGIAALTLGLNTSLQGTERTPLVWFLVTFPLLVLGVFSWLVCRHHEKLYAPGDYRSDDVFLVRKDVRERHAAELETQQEQLKAQIQELVVAYGKHRKDDSAEADSLAVQVARAVDKATNITVDGRTFTGNESAVYSFPVAMLDSVSALGDEVYFKINEYTRPYFYGHTWVLRNKASGQVLKTRGMSSGLPAGTPVHDERALSEVGIKPGDELVIERVP